MLKTLLELFHHLGINKSKASLSTTKQFVSICENDMFTSFADGLAEVVGTLVHLPVG